MVRLIKKGLFAGADMVRLIKKRLFAGADVVRLIKKGLFAGVDVVRLIKRQGLGTINTRDLGYRIHRSEKILLLLCLLPIL